MDYLKRISMKALMGLRDNSLRHLKELKSGQWMASNEYQLCQQNKLKELLKHASIHVPYYGKLFSEYKIVNKAGDVVLERFNKIPLLNKALIHKQFESLKSNDLDKREWELRGSGGSTGEPVKFIQDKNYSDWRLALKFFYDEWCGYKLSERKIQLWGSEIDLKKKKRTLRDRTRRWLLNRVTLNSFLMTPKQMAEYVEKINTFKPVLIVSYAESLFDLACFIEKNGCKVHSPRSIMTSAGILFPHMRKKIERVFNASIFNRYGTREVGDLGCECEYHTGIHVSGLTHYIEILHPDGTPCKLGESGEIVVTLLTNYAMPLIRYQLEDVSAWSEEACICGRGMPLLKDIEGRVSGIFLRKDGARVNGIYFTPIMIDHEWIKIFRLIQMDYNEITVLIVPYEDVSNPQDALLGSQDKIEEDIQLVMGKECRISFQFVDKIDPTVSGKNIYALSKITQQDTFESIMS